MHHAWFQAIRPVRAIGQIDIETTQLQRDLTPHPARFLRVLSRVLPVVAKTRNENLYEDLRHSEERLEIEPTDVHEFIRLLDALRVATQRQEEWREAMERVNDLFTIVEEEEFPAPEQLRTSHQMTCLLYVKVGQLVQRVQSVVEADKTKFGRELETTMPRLRAAILDTKRRADEMIVHNARADPDDALQHLRSVDEAVIRLSEEATTYSRYQTILRLTRTDFSQLHELKEDVSLKLRLWQSV